MFATLEIVSSGSITVVFQNAEQSGCENPNEFFQSALTLFVSTPVAATLTVTVTVMVPEVPDGTVPMNHEFTPDVGEGIALT
jgi:hypothetical protein